MHIGKLRWTRQITNWVVFEIKIEIQLSINVGSTAIIWQGRAAGGRKKNKNIYLINRRKRPASNIIVVDDNML